MPLPVKLDDVAEMLDVPGPEMAAYISQGTGEILLVNPDTVAELESGEEAEDLEFGFTDEAKRVVALADCIALPDKFEVESYSIMEDYCYTLEDDRLRGTLLDAIKGRGAFSRFKELVHRSGIENDWHDFRDRAMKEIAADFLEANGIPYEDS